MNNLKLLRKQTKKTQSQIADYLGITQQGYACYENETRTPPTDMTVKLADFYDVSVDYLLGREEKSSPVKESKGKWINVYGNIAAGIPIEAIEDIIDQEEITAEMAAHGEYIALKIKGDSMEPKISEGDTVIIKLQDTIESGEIAAVLVNGNDATLKRVRFVENGIWLIGDNPAFTPIFYTQKQCAELPVRILGKLVELRAKF